jgi:hypothetical protein
LHLACRSKKAAEIRGLLLRQAEVPAAFIAMIETRPGQVEKVHQPLERDENVLRRFPALGLVFHAALLSISDAPDLQVPALGPRTF